jgi:hypothetical protein
LVFVICWFNFFVDWRIQRIGVDMTDKEAMAKELEELAGKFSEGWHEGIKIDASDIMLLSQAAEVLVQPDQEPVAWMDADGNVSDNNDHKCFPIPLYTTPPQRTEPLIGCVNHDCALCKEKNT